MAESIRVVAVIGVGVIGSSWACLFLAKGLKVIISDPAPDAKQAFEQFLESTWPSLERLGLGAEASKTNYEFVDDIVPYLIKVDFVQENGPENPDLKTTLIASLDAGTRPEVVIASSSSGLPSSKFIGQCRNNPCRVLIGHPFNPPHIIPLVEVVPHSDGSESYTRIAMDFYSGLGKRPIHIKKEVPGFVANRIQAALNNEAYALVSRGIVSAEDLDAAITTGPGLRWALNGPIVTNSLGGGGGKDGFSQRLDKLGQAIQSWERDILDHRFNWQLDEIDRLKVEANAYLDNLDIEQVKDDRDTVLPELLLSKSRTRTLV